MSSSIAISDSSSRELVKRGFLKADVEDVLRKREGVLCKAEEGVVCAEAFERALAPLLTCVACASGELVVKKDPPSLSLTRDRPLYSCPRLLGRDVRLVRPGAPEPENVSIVGDVLYSDCPTLKDIERCTDELGCEEVEYGKRFSLSFLTS